MGNEKSARFDVVIRQLQQAPIGSRTLDGQVAYLLGWERRSFPYVDKKSGEKGERLFWVNPGTADPDKVPRYTTNLQSAYELANQISPTLICAVTWGGTGSNASVEYGNRTVEAAATSAPLALCIAILSAAKPA
ncbi:hypothetical protein ASG03_18380 [Rhizobium sp. Leaf341]|nr:hypothetical protein ASG03_18380 [Rhizobium sp. Leaf341]